MIEQSQAIPAGTEAKRLDATPHRPSISACRYGSRDAT
jgi:hypothetical protein